MNKTIALIGNPNSGKTTLFNALTGSYQKTGNWTGVTTEKKSSKYKKDKNVEIVDLPGLYSLQAKSIDEINALNYLNDTPPSVIINVVDATNLSRNLYLTCELTRLGIPMIIAVNMCDQLESNKIKLEEKALSNLFGVSVVQISALENFNVDLLMEKAKNERIKPKKLFDKSALPQDVYKFIDKNISAIIIEKQTRAQKFTLKADRVLMHKIWGIPIFLSVLTAMYFLAIKVGGIFGGGIANFFEYLSIITSDFLLNNGVPKLLVDLSCNVIIGGIGTVTSFFPQILILFTIMAIIEESGYSSRIAFVLDRFFTAFGLSGKSIIPMIMSCGCAVSGLMATRTIEDLSERRMTIFLSPFMPCGAKSIVFAWFAQNFFGGSALVATSLYVISIICIAVFGKLLKRFKCFKDSSGTFLLEIPTLKIPSYKDVFYVLIDKSKEFAVKAGMIIFIVSVMLWVLKNFGVNGFTYGIIDKSFLYSIGNAISWVFTPLGFGNWQSGVAVITSFFAKEAVIESLGALTQDVGSLFFNKCSMYAFMSFVLISPPCIASIATAKKELGNKKWFVGMLFFQLVSAYIVSFIINLIGIILMGGFGLLLSVLIGIIIVMTVIICVVKLKSACKNCQKCRIGENKCPKTAKRSMT